MNLSIYAIFSAILHNGTRLVLENYHLASISWDSYLGNSIDLFLIFNVNYEKFVSFLKTTSVLGAEKIMKKLISGSFLYILGGTNYYFKSGTCVRPPPKGIAVEHFFAKNKPDCDCSSSRLRVCSGRAAQRRANRRLRSHRRSACR